MSSMQYELVSPWWLAGLVPLVLLLLLRRNTGTGGVIQFPGLGHFGKYGKPPGSRAGRLGPLLMAAACAAMLLALARPQTVDEESFSTASGIDILLALDISGSMDTDDMRISGRRVSRLQSAKAVMESFIEQRPEDRIGLITFAGKTKPAAPLTLDHELVISQLRGLQSGMIQADGTAIGSAIAAAASRLQERKDTKSRVIILVTDGASNSGQLSPVQAAELASKLGIKVYTIAVGTENGRLPRHLAKQEFDEPTLMKIAGITRGEHYRARDTESLAGIFGTIDKLEKTEAKKHIIKRVEELFPWCLWAAFGFVGAAGFWEVFRRRPSP